MGKPRIRLSRTCLVSVLQCVACCAAETTIYSSRIEIWYDVVRDGVVRPDTPVWGVPDTAALPNGVLNLLIDDDGTVTGSSLVEGQPGTAMLLGERLYGPHNFTMALADGTCGTPVSNVAPISDGAVLLRDTFIGDFDELRVTSGFIKDGNSGDFFDLRNGVGLDGKMEFTATGPDGMTFTFNAKGANAGTGTGWYTFAFDGGQLRYDYDTDSAGIGLTGVVPIDVRIDAATRTFHIPEATMLEGFPAGYLAPGRRIDDFSGTIDSNGRFIGTAHFAGLEFGSLAFTTADGVFEDGNSPGFDVSNGLLPGDSLVATMTDRTGKFDLVIAAALVSGDTCDADADCDDLVDCTDDRCVAGACTSAANDAQCDDDDPCTVDTCHLTTGCANVADATRDPCVTSRDAPSETLPQPDAERLGDESGLNTEPVPEATGGGIGPAGSIGCGALGIVTLGALVAGLTGLRTRRRTQSHETL